jgi:hypothetical protein
MHGQHHCYGCALTVRQRDGQDIQRYKRRHQKIQVFELCARVIIGMVISTVRLQFSSEEKIRWQPSTAVSPNETYDQTHREASISARHDGYEEQRSQGSTRGYSCSTATWNTTANVGLQVQYGRWTYGRKRVLELRSFTTVVYSTEL